MEPTPPEESPDSPGESELKKGGRKSKREEEKGDEEEEMEGEKDDGFKKGLFFYKSKSPPKFDVFLSQFCFFFPFFCFRKGLTKVVKCFSYDIIS